MAISTDEKQNFETLRRACKNGDLALMECKDRKTGERVVVIGAVNCHVRYSYVPLAKMLTNVDAAKLELPQSDNRRSDPLQPGRKKGA